jgi:hypothetical protein
MLPHDNVEQRADDAYRRRCRTKRRIDGVTPHVAGIRHRATDFPRRRGDAYRATNARIPPMRPRVPLHRIPISQYAGLSSSNRSRMSTRSSRARLTIRRWSFRTSLVPPKRSTVPPTIERIPLRRRLTTNRAALGSPVRHRCRTITHPRLRSHTTAHAPNDHRSASPRSLHPPLSAQRALLVPASRDSGRRQSHATGSTTTAHDRTA